MSFRFRLVIGFLACFCRIHSAKADVFTFFDSTDALGIQQALDPGNTFFSDSVDASSRCHTLIPTITTEICSLSAVGAAGFGGSAFVMSAPFTPFFVDIVDPSGHLSDRISYTPSSAPAGDDMITFQSDSDLTPLTPLPGAATTITENGDIQKAFTVTWVIPDNNGNFFIATTDTIQFQSDLDGGGGGGGTTIPEPSSLVLSMMSVGCFVLLAWKRART